MMGETLLQPKVTRIRSLVRVSGKCIGDGKGGKSDLFEPDRSGDGLREALE